MSQSKAREARQVTRIQGREAFPKPVHNFTDLPDTRAQRRDKKFRKKIYAAQLKASSYLEHVMDVNRWRAAFSALPVTPVTPVTEQENTPA